jgi:membrane protein implicated in regulation of membrane protease activity
VNIEGFRRFYGGLLIVFSIIMLAVQYQIILWNLGIKTNPNMVVVIAVSAVIVWMFVWYYRARRKKKQFD